MALNRKRALAAAEKYVGKGKLDAAIKEYRKVLKETPNDTGTLNRLGDLLARKGRLQEAIEMFEQTARHYADDGFFVKAIAIYKKIIRLDPDRLDVYEHLADLYQRQGLTKEARTQYDVVIERCQARGDSEGVIRAYQRMADLDPVDPAPRVRLAEIFLERQQVDLALAEHTKIANVMIEHGSVDQAVSVLTRALAIAPQDLGFATSAVLSLKQAGHPSAARSVMEEAVRLNPQAERIVEVAGLAADAEAADLEPAALEIDEPAEPAVAEPDSDLELDQELADVPAALDLDAVPAQSLELEDADEFELLDPEAALDLPPPAGDQPAADEAEPLDEDEVVVLDLEEDLTPEVVLAEEDEVVVLDLEDDVTPEAALAEAAITIDGPEAPANVEEVAPVQPQEVDEPALEALVEDDEPEVEVTEQIVEEAAEMPAAEVRPPGRTIEIEVTEDDLPDDGDEHLAILIEAENFMKYGLRDKAVEKLEEVLEIDPDNAMALGRMLEVQLERNDRQQISRLSRQLASIYEQRGDLEAWDVIQKSLAAAGYVFRSGELAIGRATDEMPELVADDVREPAPDELLPDQLFGSDDASEDFFDLAAELVQELESEDHATSVGTESQSLDQIVEGFKQGVSESLSAEDYDTHFNLGIAYRRWA